MDNSQNNTKTAIAKSISSQRLRVVTGDGQNSAASVAARLEKKWITEGLNVELQCSKGKLSAIDGTVSHTVPCWKKEALKKTTDYPEPPRLQNQQKYSSIFLPTVFGKGTPSAVHLEDYDSFIDGIAKAPSYRLRARLGTISGYPVAQPTIPAFPGKITPLLPKPFPEAPKEPVLQLRKLKWYEHFLSLAVIDPRAGDNELFALKYELYRKELENYHRKRDEIEKYNSWLIQLQEDRQRYWEAKKQAFDQACIDEWSQHNAEWEKGASSDQEHYAELSNRYEQGGSENVLSYIRANLDAIPLPRWCPRIYELAFDEEQGILVIDLQLPFFDGLDILKTRRLVSGDKLVPANQKEAKEINDQLPYLIILRFLWEVPQVDTPGKVKAVCCNGCVVYDDPATGQSRQDTIMSVLVRREELLDINLSKVQPDTCFTSLKGISAAKISDLVPVQPIIQFNKYEGRFIESKDVLDTVGDTNLATMDWQEFEHLVRELFEKEFGTEGAEVKITQASRDRGVDAIAFDPDPVLGELLNHAATGV